jgi:hypothetical protein
MQLDDVSNPRLQLIVDRGRWMDWRVHGRLVVLFANLVACCLSCIVYLRRALDGGETGPQSGTLLGLDRRLAMQGLGGLFASLILLGALLLPNAWNVCKVDPPKWSNSRVVSSSWKTTMAIADIYTAAEIHGILSVARLPLRQTVIPTIVEPFPHPALLLNFWGFSNYAQGPRALRGSRLISKVLASAIISTPTVLQLWKHIAEIQDIKKGKYTRWNYRWMEKDPLVLGWWII